jgi:hypothetical protein
MTNNCFPFMTAPDYQLESWGRPPLFVRRTKRLSRGNHGTEVKI